LHPELVAMLREWLQGISPGEKLFPMLGRRKTWRMVKKDLERVGIAYQTEDGIADFHAAGRHTHITELLRNGASLPEAKELARHSDIKTTMRYAHIGLNDQARAVAALPAGALHGRCISGVSGRPSESLIGGDDPAEKRQNPRQGKGFDAACRNSSKNEKVGATGFEPATSWSRTKRSSQAEPRPAKFSLARASFNRRQRRSSQTGRRRAF
jgi:Phage integrase family